MNFETFRAEMIMHMQDSGFDTDMINRVLNAVDPLADKYDISIKETALSIVNGVPEVVKMYVASRSVENLSKGTLANYYNILNLLFKKVNKQFDQITANDIRIFLFWYKEERKVKDSTLGTVRTVINTFFQWLSDEDYIQKNPVKRIPTIKQGESSRRALTPVELERVRDACANLRQKAIVDFLYSTGCRVTEASCMKIEDVDFSTKEVKILHGKGNKSRISYLNPEAEISLRKYLSSRDDDCPYLFVTNYGNHRQMRKRTIEEEVEKLGSLAGIDFKLTPHIFRHTAATTALKRGMNIEQVQRFLGHSKITTTLIYAKVDNESVKASHTKYVA